MLKAGFGSLDQNPVINITTYLGFQDVVNLSRSSKTFNFVADNNAVWKFQICNYFNLELLYIAEDFIAKSPKEQFLSLIDRYNNIRGFLANIVKKVSPHIKVKELLHDHFSNQRAKNDLDKLISEVYERIPIDYYILYRLLNGQKALGGKFTQDVSLFGGYFYYDFIREFHFLPLGKPENADILVKNKIPTLTMCYRSGVRLFVDFHNLLKQGHGTIFSFIDKRTEYGKTIVRAYIFKSSIVQLLQDLQYCSYLPEEELIDHFDSFNRPLSDVTTQGIRVRTATVLDAWDRRPGYLFAYQIRISPNGVDGEWTLTTRHWIINDNGVPNEVEGPGVIGLYPKVKEGCNEFTYQSCTPMSGFNGTMKGELYFKKKGSGEEIPVIVGEMKMKMPPGSAFIDLYPDEDKAEIVARSEQ